MNLKKSYSIFLFALCGLLAVAVVGSVAVLSRGASAESPYYTGASGSNRVALCFNVDWGEEYMPGILDTLRENEAAATFFLTGRWTEKFPDQAMAIKKAGMEIGNHGLKHSSPNQMSYEENAADIAAAEAILERTLHIKTNLFAPAAGEIDEQVLRAATDSGYQVILWSVDTIDWQKPDVATIVSRVEKKVGDGAIILMHPTENTAKALPEILSLLKVKNLQPVSVSELLIPKDSK